MSAKQDFFVLPSRSKVEALRSFASKVWCASRRGLIIRREQREQGEQGEQGDFRDTRRRCRLFRPCRPQNKILWVHMSSYEFLWVLMSIFVGIALPIRTHSNTLEPI